MEEDTEAMLVINGHWQDAACWKGRRRISGWSQILPGSAPEAGCPPWSRHGLESRALFSLGHAFFGVSQF